MQGTSTYLVNSSKISCETLNYINSQLYYVSNKKKNSMKPSPIINFLFSTRVQLN